MAELNSNQGPKEQSFIASVLFAEIAGYADYPVFKQIQFTTQMRQLLECALALANSRDLLSVDREESVVLLFPGDPTDCFALAKQLSEVLAGDETYRDLPLHVGVNLGPVTMSTNELSVPQVNGVGVEDAARVARFGLLREVLISRAYYTVFARISKDYGLLQYREFLSDDSDESFAIYQIARPSTSPLTPPVLNPSTLPAFAPTARPGLRWRYAAVSAMVAVGAFAIYQIQPSDPLPAIHVPKAETTKAEWAAKREAQAAPAAAVVAVEPIPSPADAGASTALAPESAANAAEIVAKVHFHHAITSSTPQAPLVQRTESTKQVVAAAPIAKAATLRLAIKPWGEVYVDGKKVGVTPPIHKIKLTPGKRNIEVRNADFLPYHATLDARPDELLQISHRFDK